LTSTLSLFNVATTFSLHFIIKRCFVKEHNSNHLQSACCIRKVGQNAEGVAKNAEEIARLKKVSNELDVRGQEDEKRVSELNVTVENLNMNVSMQHRTVIAQVEDRKSFIHIHFELRPASQLLSSKTVSIFDLFDCVYCAKCPIIDSIDNACMYPDKELIDQHTKDIEMLKNKPEVVIPEMPDVKAGDGLDMAQLMNMFACKSPPDNTIKRIEALENQLANLPKPEIVHVEAKAEAAASTGLDQDAMDKLNDLLRRV